MGLGRPDPPPMKQPTQFPPAVIGRRPFHRLKALRLSRGAVLNSGVQVDNLPFYRLTNQLTISTVRVWTRAPERWRTSRRGAPPQAGSSASFWAFPARRCTSISESEQATVEIEVGSHDLQFRVRDSGIGLFHSIQRKFGLTDESAAIGELLKGKTTTQPQRHSGEGIYFTSKVADFMALRSHRARLVFYNQKTNVHVEQVRFAPGTDVLFCIRRRSRRRLGPVFAAYAPEEFDYQFQRTRAQVKLLVDACVSRSQARRLLHSLDRFTEVVLDFGGVKVLGQAFADEVFRVFPAAHPGLVLKTEDLAPVLEPMRRHVVDKPTSERLTVG